MAFTSPTPDYSLPEILPRAALEQMIVERTITDAAFRQSLLDNPVAALGTFFGKPLPEGVDVRVYVEDANTYYYVSSSTDPEGGAFETVVGVSPPLMSSRENFMARLNYLLSDTDADPDDLDRLTQAMNEADALEETASTEARNTEIAAVQAAQVAEDAEIAYAEALAAAALAPNDPDLAQAVADAETAMQQADQTASDARRTASEARQASGDAAVAATAADDAYEDALRAAFQQQFAADPLAAMNQFLNLETPFTSFQTIRDTDPPGNLPPVSTDGVCFTHLVETTGQVFFLVLPYANHRSLLMGPYSIRLDGATSYIQVPRSPSLTTHSLLTVEAWVWVDAFRPGTQDVVLSTLTSGGGWQLEVGGGIPKFTVTLDGVAQALTPNQEYQIGNVTVDTGSLRLETSQWYYLVGIFEGETLMLYVNGYKWAEAQVGGQITPGGDLLMGRNAAMQDDQSFFMGMIHEARLWGDALTEDVVSGNITTHQDMNGIPTTLLEHLIAHYVFDEGANFTALDDSLNHNDGAMVNAVWQITGRDSPA